MRKVESFTLPHVERSGFEVGVSEEERSLVEGVHRFARDVLRPLGMTLDRMSAADVSAPDSPLWSVYRGFTGLGFDHDFFNRLEPGASARLESLIVEELGWGDAGLAASIGAGGMASRLAYISGNRELIEMSHGRVSCWPVTHPAHGSDMADFDSTERHPLAGPFEPQLLAKVGKHEIRLTGESTSFISNGSIAQLGVVCCPADYGDGVQRSDGTLNMAVVYVPLELAGVSRGPPLEKLGLLALPQGAVKFDDVKVPRRFALGDGENALPTFLTVVCAGGVYISQANTGLARAAFEHALAFAHERHQGGMPLIRHQAVRLRLGEMFKKLEAARAMTHRAARYLRLAPTPHPNVSLMSKAFVSQVAFEVANEAMQIFGGRGLNRDSPVEKLMRDARAASVEEGENQFLTLKLGGVAAKLYQEGWAHP